MVTLSILEEELHDMIQRYRRIEQTPRTEYVIAMCQMMLHMVLRYPHCMEPDDVNRMYRILLEITK